RARRRGVLSLRQVSLHKQRKVARAVTARKLLISIRLLPGGRRTGAARCARPLIRRCAPPSPASGRRASSSGKREKCYRQVSRQWKKDVGPWDIATLGSVQRLPRRPRDLRRQLRRSRRRQVLTELRVHAPPLGDTRVDILASTVH